LREPANIAATIIPPLAFMLVQALGAAAGPVKQAVARLAADAKRTVTRAASLPTPDPIPVLA